MDTRKGNFIAIAAICVTGTILLCTGLFWARTYCAAERDSLLGRSAREAAVSPTRVLDPNRTQDPNLAAPFVVTARIHEYHLPLAELDAVRYLAPLIEKYEYVERFDQNLYRRDPRSEGDVLRYDPSLGLFVYTRTAEIRNGNRSSDVQVTTQYAGPEGLADRPGGQLGRFISPIADRLWIKPQVVYDRGMKRFFAIDWDGKTPGVRKGPELSEDAASREPVQIGSIWKNPDLMVWGFPSPQSHDAQGVSLWGRDHVLWRVSPWGGDRVLILDASGRIDRLDLGTLDYAGLAGHLSAPASPIGSAGTARPMDLAAYGVCGFEMARGDSPREWVYGGCTVASVGREGLALRLDYFDPNGQAVAVGSTAVAAYDDPRSQVVRLGRPVESAEAAYFVLPGSRGLTWMKLLLENLHPPALVLASYLGGPHFEATAGYRSIFLLPDSFVAMVARGHRDAVISERFFRALGYMLPGLLLFGLLSVKISRDGIRMGTPRNVRRAWVVATMTLGLPAYLAYRLARPKVTLVTCHNCGQARRPDLDRCNRCGSVWDVPELTPPMWRVVCAPEPDQDNSPAPAQETKQSA
ncbi:MAG: hypothetical protein ABFE01_26310 [Phycisphaerales bacterium]